MPKVYLTEKDKKAAKAAENGKYIMGTISKYAEVRDMSTEELCILCGMGRTRFYSRRKNMGDMTLHELSAIMNALKIPFSELSPFLEGFLV